MKTPTTTAEIAIQIHKRLLAADHTLVIAESCTAGRIAATLAEVPGASRVLAGSAVVYQIPTKVAWLHIPEATFDDADAVSSTVAHEMATGVLRQTPHASIALAITGHLGPNAPEDLDGTAWVAIANGRNGKVVEQQFLLDREAAELSHGMDSESTRLTRQAAAVHAALNLLLNTLHPEHTEC